VLEKPRVVQPPTVPAAGKTALATPAFKLDAVIGQRLAVKPHVPGLPAVMLQVPVAVVEVAAAAAAVHVSEPTEVAVYVPAQPGVHTPAVCTVAEQAVAPEPIPPFDVRVVAAVVQPVQTWFARVHVPTVVQTAAPAALLVQVVCNVAPVEM